MFKVLLSLVALLVPILASADSIDVPTPSTGSRSTPDSSGVHATGGWSDAGAGFIINWDISQVGSNYHYIYTITNDSGGALDNGMSHFILEVSPTFTSSDIFDANVSFEGPITFSPSDPGNSNPSLPGNIFGIKFNAEGVLPVIDFMSTRPPIWGDFYTKDGKDPNFDHVDVFAYNTGFGTDPTLATQDFTNWIPVPDTGVPVPEPSTYLIMATVLLGLTFLRLHRTKKLIH